MSRPAELLYNLLPAYVRNRDAAEGEPVRALMLVLEQQYWTLHDDIGTLYRNAFIETCEDWMVPYIGELLGVRPELAELSDRPRQWVADVLAFRRGKGVPAVLRRAVETATGWRARIVEPGAGIATSPDLGHPELPSTPSGRAPRFEPGPCAPGELAPGEVGVEIRRLRSFSLDRAWARKLGDGRYTFHPFGIDTPLGPPSPPAVPGEGTHDAAGSPARPSFEIRLGGRPVDPADIEITDLADWRRPAPREAEGEDERPDRVVVDPRRGRLALATDAPRRQAVEVAWSYGACAEIGGGPYGRATTLEPPDALPWRAVVGRRLPAAGTEAPAAPRFRNLWQALAAWKASGESGVIRILDSATYLVSRSGPFEAELDGGRRLVIEAADGCRPCLVGTLRLAAGGAGGGTARLNGLLLDGALRAEGALVVELVHTTVRPPQPGEKPVPRVALTGTGAGDLTAEGGTAEPPLRLRLVRSICGPVGLASGAAEVEVEDAVLDAGGGQALVANPGARLVASLSGSTVFGAVSVRQMPRAASVLFTGPVQVAARREGVLVHCFVPLGSATPPRHHCQPDGAIETAGESGTETDQNVRHRLRPSFTSRRYGDPGYAQLDRRCPPEIRRGGEAGGEIGVHHLLGEHRREAVLEAVLEEYVPWGLSPRVFYAD